MKTVFVYGIRGFPFVGGGAERHCEELYPRLAKMDYDVTILCRRYFFPVWKGVKFIRLPFIDNKYLETFSHSIMCGFYCLFKRPRIVHIHNMGACLLIPILGMMGIRVVLTIHSLNYQHKKWGHFARFVLNTLENIGISFAAKKVVVSKKIRDLYWKKFSRTISIHIIPNGVNEPIIIPPGLTLRKYKLKPQKYILAVGRLVAEKRLHILIKYYKEIKNPDYKLVIVGNGERNSNYKEKLHSQQNENIIFTGFLCGKELAELYTNAGLFISASSEEGFPLTVLEALSYGLPLLLNNIPAHREIQLPESRYFKDDKELPLKIEFAIEKGISDEKKEKYKKILKKKYNWDALTQKINDLYEF